MTLHPLDMIARRMALGALGSEDANRLGLAEDPDERAEMLNELEELRRRKLLAQQQQMSMSQGPLFGGTMFPGASAPGLTIPGIPGPGQHDPGADSEDTTGGLGTATGTATLGEVPKTDDEGQILGLGAGEGDGGAGGVPGLPPGGDPQSTLAASLLASGPLGDLADQVQGAVGPGSGGMGPGPGENAIERQRLLDLLRKQATVFRSPQTPSAVRRPR